MWAVESNGVVSSMEERQRVGFHAATPGPGQEPTLTALLSHAMSANASTGGGARFLLLEEGAAGCARKAIDEVLAEEEAAQRAHTDSGFVALVGQSAESAATQAWLNPVLPVTSRLFYVLRLTEDCHRFPDAVGQQVKACLEGLGIRSLDLVLLPWPADPSELSRHVRNRQTDLFLKAWNGPIASLKADGLVKDVGVDGLTVWQLERIIDDAHESPAFNALSMSPQHARYDEVRFCQSRGIEVVALLGGTPDGGGHDGASFKHAGPLAPVPPSPEDPSRKPEKKKVSAAQARANASRRKGRALSVADVAKAIGRTPLQVEITWALQRGLIAVPNTSFPEREVRTSRAWKPEWATITTKRAGGSQADVTPLACPPPARYFTPRARFSFFVFATGHGERGAVC